MYVLTYFVQDQDLSEFSLIASSENKAKLEELKIKLLKPSQKWREDRAAMIVAKSEEIKKFCELNADALKDRSMPNVLEPWKNCHPNYATIMKEKIIANLCQEHSFYLFVESNKEYLYEYFNVNKIIGDIPKYVESAKPNPYYIDDTWGNQGLHIQEVEII